MDTHTPDAEAGIAALNPRPCTTATAVMSAFFPTSSADIVPLDALRRACAGGRDQPVSAFPPTYWGEALDGSGVFCAYCRTAFVIACRVAFTIPLRQYYADSLQSEAEPEPEPNCTVHCSSVHINERTSLRFAGLIFQVGSADGSTPYYIQPQPQPQLQPQLQPQPQGTFMLPTNTSYAVRVQIDPLCGGSGASFAIQEFRVNGKGIKVDQHAHDWVVRRIVADEAMHFISPSQIERSVSCPDIAPVETVLELELKLDQAAHASFAVAVRLVCVQSDEEKRIDNYRAAMITMGWDMIVEKARKAADDIYVAQLALDEMMPMLLGMPARWLDAYLSHTQWERTFGSLPHSVYDASAAVSDDDEHYGCGHNDNDNDNYNDNDTSSDASSDTNNDSVERDSAREQTDEAELLLRMQATRIACEVASLNGDC
jgi:hypothetical protein